MWAAYHSVAKENPRLSFHQERRLIAKAQRGSADCANRLVLSHVGFVMFRLRTIVYPHVLWRLGDDLLADAVLMLYEKVGTYDLGYRDRQGRRKPVRFVSYVWKRVDGFIIDALNRERRLVRVEDIDSVKPSRIGWRPGELGGYPMGRRLRMPHGQLHNHPGPQPADD
jgi:hypothetical protein